MKNAIIGFLIGALLTGGAFLFVPADKAVVTPICQEQEKIIETKYVDTLKDCPSLDEEKIEKAFLLFLASVGIRNTQQYAATVNQLVANPSAYEPTPVMPTAEPTQSFEETQVFYDRSAAIKQLNASEMWREISDYDQGLKQLANSLLKDPAVYFARAKTIQDMKVLRRIKGTYVGKFYRMIGKNKGKVEDVEMTVDFWAKDKKIDGSFNMTIARDGVVWSNMRGNGNNDNVYTNPLNPKQIIIKAAPGMYFQFEDEKLFQANVYDEGEFIGVSTLTRQ